MPQMTKTFSFTFGLLIAVLMTSATYAEDTYTGVVAVDRVPVRAGVGRTFYAVGTLEKGDKVTVSKVVYGWYRVLPPKGVYSYVRKDAIQVNGGKGVVLTNGVRVTAASIEGPGGSYRRQLDLKKGTDVVIAGEDGGYYKIKPPAGTFVYLPPNSVKKEVKKAAQPATPITKEAEIETGPGAEKIQVFTLGETQKKEGLAAGTQQLAVKSDPTNNPLGIDIGGPGAAATTKKSGSKSVTQQKTDATQEVKPEISEAEKLKKLEAEKREKERLAAEKATKQAIASAEKAEKRVRDMLKKPISDQQCLEVKALLQSVLANEALPGKEKKLMTARLAQTDRNIALQKIMSDIQKVKETPLEDEKVEIQPPAPRYDYVGRLTISSVFADSSGPKFYRLVDTSGNTIGYIQKAGNEKLEAMIGKVVGIVGSSEVEPEMRIKLISVKQVEAFGVMSSKEAVASFEE